MQFVHLKQFPKFVDVESEEDIKDDGNYYTVLPKKTSNLLRKYQRKTGRDIKQLKNMYKLFNWKEKTIFNSLLKRTND